MSEFKPLARKADIVVQDLRDEILIYDLVTNKALALNKTSSIVWQYCDGTKTIKELADLLSIKFKTIITNDFVWMSIEQLKKENLIEIGSLQYTPFEGLSRREMVRKVGLTSLIALPIISSLIVPTAVNAASGCFPLTNNANENPNGCACDTNSDCTSTCCGVSGLAEVCVNLRATAVCQPCRGNCECPNTYSCPSIAGRPRICRPVGVPVPPLPAPDNCV